MPLVNDRSRTTPALAPRALWQAVLGELQVGLARPSYETFLKDTVAVSYGAAGLKVSAPSSFVAEYLQQKLYPLVKQTVEKVAKQPLDVAFQVETWRDPDEPNGEHAPPVREWQVPVTTGPSLNGRYTFENFIVGKSNQLAHAAAVVAAEQPGQNYNPVFIYSGVGLGKTHLLHAIAHRVLARGLSVLYLSAEQFTNEFITSIREGRTADFNARFSSVDVVLLDDVYSLSGKEQTQERFFHLFNERHQANKQMVLTSDRPPSDLTALVDRLRSRFGMGLIGDIQLPDLETRLAILRSKAKLRGALVPDEVLLLLARKVQRSIRDLEGNLNRVLALAELTGAPITKATAMQASAGLDGGGEQRPLAPDELVLQVARYYSLSPTALQGPSREKKVALARHVAMFVLHQEAGLTLSQIGRLLGGRDHSTVDHACKRIEHQSNLDPKLRADLLSIREAIQKTPA